MDIYRENIAAPGAATAMLNWYRRAAPDLFHAQDLDVQVETPVLIVWGTEDVALGEACLAGTALYVSDLRIELLPGVSHFSPEEAPDKVSGLIENFLFGRLSG
jgi:pimeloyl-ACP methyl ester carboxylesterase